ncbi:MAG: hypothetical protein GWM98_12175, partial [Nitrospinaceae bacterium]|nr:hypothetical protein [Nitrospinaceae bacterium]
HPQNTVILNLDLDHQPVRETSRMFRTLVSHTKHHCFYNADDRNLPGLMPKDAVTFSIETDSTFRVDDLRLQPLG